MEPFEGFKVGETSTNCYIIRDGEEVAVIDPGAEPDRIADIISSSTENPHITIFLTQGHFDHFGACEKLTKLIPTAGVYIGTGDNPLIFNPALNLSLQAGQPCTLSGMSDLLHAANDNEEITVGSLVFRIITTPGHSPGSVCVYLEGDNLLFTGDTLMKNAVGPTHIPFGDQRKLLISLRDKILRLPDATKILPGHGPSSTIGDEKSNNPYIKTFAINDTL